MAITAVEKSKTRADLAQLAGRGPFSFIAMLAGVLVGYATCALLVGGAAAIVRGTGSDVDLTGSWDTLGWRAGLLLGGLLFVSYLWAGYVAGRMAWRRGWLHGLAVFIGSVAVVSAVALLVRTLANAADVERILDAFRTFGIPTTREEWGNADSVVGLASLGGMLLGSVLGGVLGERWYTKVSRSAVSAEVDLRERMEESNERRTEESNERLAPVTAGTATAGTATAGNGDRARTGEDAADGTDAELDVDDMTKEELYHRAQERDIPGRSNMTKDELKDALQDR